VTPQTTAHDAQRARPDFRCLHEARRGRTSRHPPTSAHAHHSADALCVASSSPSPHCSPRPGLRCPSDRARQLHLRLAGAGQGQSPTRNSSCTTAKRAHPEFSRPRENSACAKSTKAGPVPAQTRVHPRVATPAPAADRA